MQLNNRKYFKTKRDVIWCCVAFRTKYDNRIYLIANTVQTLNSPLYFHYLLASYKEITHTHSKSKGSDVHTFRVQAKGIQLKFDTSWIPMYKSDKPDSKVLLLIVLSPCADLKLVTFNTWESQRWRASHRYRVNQHKVQISNNSCTYS